MVALIRCWSLTQYRSVWTLAWYADAERIPAPNGWLPPTELLYLPHTDEWYRVSNRTGWAHDLRTDYEARRARAHMVIEIDHDATTLTCANTHALELWRHALNWCNPNATHPPNAVMLYWEQHPLMTAHLTLYNGRIRKYRV